MDLWALVEPLLPPAKPRRKRFPGRKPIDNRKALTGILFVLKTGISWEDLPQEMGCGSGMTCWRRLQRPGRALVCGKSAQAVVDQAAPSTSDRLVQSGRGQRFCTRCFWGGRTGPNPTDRGKAGSKHHLITDGQGIPLAIILTGANETDMTQLIPLVDGIPALQGRRGRPRRRPQRVQGDRGYDSNRHRQELREASYPSFSARRRTPHGSGLGAHRWVVERTLAWLHQFRRLRVRYERSEEIHQAFLLIGLCAHLQAISLASF